MLVGLSVCLVALLVATSLGLTGRLLAALPFGGGSVKQVLGIVHTVLLLLPELPYWAAGAALVGVLGPLTAALRRGERPAPRRILRGVLLAQVVGLAVFLLQAWLTIDMHARRVTDWDPARGLPWAWRIDVAPEGVHCEFHDVDVVDGGPAGPVAIVVAEGDRRLAAYRIDPVEQAGRLPLPEEWFPYGGVVLDSETDPVTGLTFFVDGPERLSWARLDADGRWQRVGQSQPVRPPMHHMRSILLPEQRRLLLVTVNVEFAPPDPVLGIVDLDHPQQVLRRPLRTADGSKLPNFREVAWVPPLQRLVLAPDFGDALWLADPETGLAEPWLSVPTLSGKVLWNDDLQRLFLTLPDRFSVWVVDPVAGRVERRIPTQPGARALAIDADRGLLLTGSVLTGHVLVQRLSDGMPTRAIGTVMPMMRELALIPGRPEAMLTTWGGLYRVRYAD